MNRFRNLAVSGYYWLTLPARQRAARLRAAQQREPLRILFYHRIADEFPNDWTMSRRDFVRQIRWLIAHYEIISLEVAQARIVSQRSKRPAVCITFDDGYADNMRFAVPFLLRHNIPFTYFVATQHISRGNAFPHDVEHGMPLRPNTWEHLRAMQSAGVEIGAHTRSHADLGKPMSQQALYDEIIGCKRELEAMLETQIKYFAFPYGLHRNLTSEAFDIARDAGYYGVCSAYGGYNHPGDDAFHLRRIHADPEFARFKNWLTVDPRKVRRQVDFSPSFPRSAPGDVPLPANALGACAEAH